MGLTMRERHAIVRELAPQFRRATKAERGRILDEFVKLTGYTRCYAAFVLRTCGKKQVRLIGTRRIVFVPGHARTVGTPRHRRRKYPSQNSPQSRGTNGTRPRGACHEAVR